MRIIITGGQGQLGTTFRKIFEQGKIHGGFAHEIFTPGKEQLNILSYSSISDTMKEYKADAVVHAAAIVDPDVAEKNEELSYRLNVVGTQNVASACANAGAKMVYIGTDYVFDGEKGTPYREFDTTNPINVYGRTKLIGEEMCTKICNKFIAVRTGILYGEKDNFVTKTIAAAKEGRELAATTDQYGCPTNTYDLAKEILFLLTSGTYGHFHLVNSGKVTRYNFVKEILRLANMPDREVKKLSSVELNRPANRPACTEMDNFMLRMVFGREMRTWEEALKDYVEEILKIY